MTTQATSSAWLTRKTTQKKARRNSVTTIAPGSMATARALPSGLPQMR